MSPDLLAIGARIEAAYKARGLNRQQFQLAIRGNYGQIMKWERGDALPGSENLMRISEVCGVSVDYLLWGEQRPMRAAPEYAAWLASGAPSDLTPEETKLLGSQEFPPGRHPGSRYYSVALSGIRAGLSERELVEGTQHAVEVRNKLT